MSIPSERAKDFARITRPEDWPRVRCYVLQFFAKTTINHEGDERSRTHPGHGYPAYSETIHSVNQYVTTDEQAWRHTIRDLYEENRSRKDFSALIVEVAKIETTVEVKFG